MIRAIWTLVSKSKTMSFAEIETKRKGNICIIHKPAGIKFNAMKDKKTNIN